MPKPFAYTAWLSTLTHTMLYTMPIGKPSTNSVSIWLSKTIVPTLAVGIINKGRISISWCVAYYSAAAYSQMGDHQNAIKDSLKAAEVDPKYSKAYSRLGHAYFSVGKYKEAVTAYEKGLELEPDNQTMKSSLATARTKARDNEVAPSARGGPGAGGAGLPPGFPDLGGLGGGAGGVPDFASLMSNPAVMNMAQQMMQSGALDSLLSNPAMQQMAQRMMSTGERPNIQEMMRDPQIAEA